MARLGGDLFLNMNKFGDKDIFSFLGYGNVSCIRITINWFAQAAVPGLPLGQLNAS